jgi:hypothetical protein
MITENPTVNGVFRTPIGKLPSEQLGGPNCRSIKMNYYQSKGNQEFLVPHFFTIFVAKICKSTHHLGLNLKNRAFRPLRMNPRSISEHSPTLMTFKCFSTSEILSKFL